MCIKTPCCPLNSHFALVHSINSSSLLSLWILSQHIAALFHCFDQFPSLYKPNLLLLVLLSSQMASPSPLVMIVSQDTTKPQPGSSNQQDYSSPKSEPAYSKTPIPNRSQQDHQTTARGRKPTKSNKSPPLKKKPSQRGMGVERLERLRLQEKWGGGGSSLPEAAVLPAHHLHQFQLPPHLLNRVAAPSSPAAHFGPQLNMDDPKVRVLGGVSCGSLMARGWVGGMLETSSKELSSIPKLMHCHHHHCDACSSKNKCHYALTGLHSNHGHNNVGLEMKDLNGMTMRKQIYHHVNKEAEMMGVTRQASGLKEYEFFPSEKGLREFEFFPNLCTLDSHTDSSTRSFEQPHHTSTEPPLAAASTYCIPSHQNTATAASNAIDLSLKLSL